MKKLLSFILLGVLCVFLLKFGGEDFTSFKNATNLRNPGDVLSPIIDQVPNVPDHPDLSGGEGGYEFDPNKKLNGSSGDSNSENTTFVFNSEYLSDSTTPSEETEETKETENLETTDPTAPEEENSTEPSNEEKTTTTTKKAAETDKATTTKSFSSKVFNFVIDGEKKILKSETTLSFMQWLEKNFKEDSDVSYTVNEYVFEDRNLDDLITSISTTSELPNNDGYDRNTFEKPSVSYTLNGTKVNRNDYAWKTSKYFNEKDFTYTCPYTGKIIKDLDDEKEDQDFGTVDFDHIVPLSSAYTRGAGDWTDEQKNAYAYDQSVGVDVYYSANRSKGDKGPAEWLPDVNRGSYCYSWLVICEKYDLTMTEEEIKVCKEEIDKAVKNGETIEFLGGTNP